MKNAEDRPGLTRLPVPEDALVLFRVWGIVAALFYPIWSVLVALLLPDRFDAPLERITVGLLFLACVAWSYRPSFPRARVDSVVAALGATYFLHFLSLVHRDSDHVYYVFATLVVIGVLAVGFRGARPLMAFSGFVLATLVAYSVGSGFEFSLAVCVVGFSATLLAAFGCMTYLRERAEQKINALLENMLPAVVVHRLKAEGGYFTERSESVTVLFADIVGFTGLTRSLQASVLIEHLNELFSRFDHATDEFHIEKIKTIGDCYMAVCGAPEEDASHRENMIRFAMRMLQLLDEFGSRHGLKLELRIGIHSGPIVSGVIGAKKTVFDIWGDTVNLASRLESHGQPGRIQVSVDTTDGISGIDFSDPHTVDLKGIGPVSACFVVDTPQPTAVA